MFIAHGDGYLHVRCVTPSGVLDIYNGTHTFGPFGDDPRCETEAAYLKAHFAAHDLWEYVGSEG